MRLSLHREKRYVLAALLALVASAWAVLWWLDGTPYAHTLHLPSIDGSAPSAHVHHQADFPFGVRFAVFVAAWQVMTIAMMLPSTLPLVDLFRHMVGRRENAGSLTSLLVAGFLAAWGGYGVAVFVLLELASPLLHELRMGDNAGVIPGALLILAGGFQFSELKYRCLRECRTPLGFILRRWTGSSPYRRSFRLGVEHGVFCVGCCWALMLLMVAANAASLVWMLVLGFVMSAEKSLRWGREIGPPLGVLMMASGTVLLTVGLFDT